MNRFVNIGCLAAAISAAASGCKKSAAGATADGATDGSDALMVVLCPPVDGGTQDDDGGTVAGIDDFGPNAPVAKAASSLGRVNIFEVTSPSLLERVDIYMRADLPRTRLTIAVQEATSRTTAFAKLTDVQIDFGVCEGWASSGPLAIALRPGRFYAMGFDPNQVVTPFVSTDGDSLPIDGMFGRLIGSRTATSVSVPALTWEKFLDKEYNRQRIVTSPRAADGLDGVGADAGTDGAAGDGPAATDGGDGGPSDANHDATDAGRG